jgi:hypothetical protein
MSQLPTGRCGRSSSVVVRPSQLFRSFGELVLVNIARTNGGNGSLHFRSHHIDCRFAATNFDQLNFFLSQLSSGQDSLGEQLIDLEQKALLVLVENFKNVSIGAWLVHLGLTLYSNLRLLKKGSRDGTIRQLYRRDKRFVLQ